MDTFESWMKEVSAYFVAGAICSIPLSVVEFPLIYPAMLLPLALSFAQVLKLRLHGFTLGCTMIWAIGPYAGLATTFHFIHGEWDYQGVLMASAGWLFVLPVLYAAAPTPAVADTNEEAQQDDTGDPTSQPPRSLTFSEHHPDR